MELTANARPVQFPNGILCELYEPATLVKAATHRIRIREVPGSNLGQDTEDP